MTSDLRLSAAQRRFLDICREAGHVGYRTPFTGNREAGRTANAWYRTARSLAVKGYVVLRPSGDAMRAFLPKFAPGSD